MSSERWCSEKKTPPGGPEVSSTLDGAALCAAYERLRGEVLGPNGGAGAPAGLGVLLQQGMVGWMKVVALSLLPVSPALRSRVAGPASSELPVGIAGQVVSVMAELLLGRLEVR